MRVRHEDRRRPGRGELPDGAAGARDREIRCGKGRPERIRRGDEHVVAPVDSAAQALVVPLARDVQDRRPCVAVGVDGEVVEAARTGECAEEGDHGSIRRQAESIAPVRLRDAAVVGRDRPARDAVLGAVAPRDPVGEEDATRERRCQPVRKPKVGIRFGERGRELLSPGRVDHRPGDVAAAAEDDMRPSLLQNRGACAWRAAGAHQRPEQRRRRPARETRDFEGVELVARLGDEPSLDAIRRPCERHADAAFPERCCDCERRQDVPGCSACRDQGSQLAGVLGHPRRC